MMKQNIRTFLLKLISTITLSFLFVVGNANAWNLKEAAAPYKGTTIRIIGEALAPLESLNQQKKIFEDETGIKVIIEQQAFDQVIEKTTADFVGGTGIYDAILNPHVKFPFLVSNGWITPIDKMLKNKKLADPNFKLKKVMIYRLRL
jgi:multiple sugar transport system substrate-binding protein